jgi:ribosomal protein S18 acetylase RimI-like enzyme
MNDRVVDDRRGDLVLSTDRRLIDVDAVLAMLLVSHWGGHMTREVLVRAIEHSVCISVFEATNRMRQVGFARVVTDLATYGYLTDVIVAGDMRGRGVGSWMVEAIVAHPDLQGLRRLALFTRDARRLYERFGFSTERPASDYMELRPKP